MDLCFVCFLIGLVVYFGIDYRKMQTSAEIGGEKPSDVSVKEDETHLGTSFTGSTVEAFDNEANGDRQHLANNGNPRGSTNLIRSPGHDESSSSHGRELRVSLPEIELVNVTDDWKSVELCDCYNGCSLNADSDLNLTNPLDAMKLGFRENHRQARHCSPVISSIPYHMIATASENSTLTLHNQNCNEPNVHDIYQMMPAYNYAYNAHYRSRWCTMANRIPSITTAVHTFVFWPMRITKACYWSEFRDVKQKFYINFLNGVLASPACDYTFLPQTDFLHTVNLCASTEGSTYPSCVRSLVDMCAVFLEASNISHSRMGHLCDLCTWVYNDTSLCNGQDNTTYLVLHVPYHYNTQMRDSSEYRCLYTDCYSWKCGPTELGDGNQCLTPAQYITGTIGKLWVKATSQTPQQEDTSPLKADIEQLFQKANLSLFIDEHVRVQPHTASAAHGTDGCMVVEVELTVSAYADYTTVQAWLNRHEYLRKDWDRASSQTLVKADGNFSLRTDSIEISKYKLRCESRQQPDANFWILNTDENFTIWVISVCVLGVIVLTIVIRAVSSYIATRQTPSDSQTDEASH